MLFTNRKLFSACEASVVNFDLCVCSSWCIGVGLCQQLCKVFCRGGQRKTMLTSHSDRNYVLLERLQASFIQHFPS